MFWTTRAAHAATRAVARLPAPPAVATPDRRPPVLVGAARASTRPGATETAPTARETPLGGAARTGARVHVAAASPRRPPPPHSVRWGHSRSERRQAAHNCVRLAQRGRHSQQRLMLLVAKQPATPFTAPARHACSRATWAWLRPSPALAGAPSELTVRAPTMWRLRLLPAPSGASTAQPRARCRSRTRPRSRPRGAAASTVTPASGAAGQTAAALTARLALPVSAVAATGRWRWSLHQPTSRTWRAWLARVSPCEPR